MKVNSTTLYDRKPLWWKYNPCTSQNNEKIGLEELPLNVPTALSTARVLRFFFLRIPASLMSTG